MSFPFEFTVGQYPPSCIRFINDANSGMLIELLNNDCIATDDNIESETNGSGYNEEMEYDTDTIENVSNPRTECNIYSRVGFEVYKHITNGEWLSRHSCSKTT